MICSAGGWSINRLDNPSDSPRWSLESLCSFLLVSWACNLTPPPPPPPPSRERIHPNENPLTCAILFLLQSIYLMPGKRKVKNVLTTEHFQLCCVNRCSVGGYTLYSSTECNDAYYETLHTQKDISKKIYIAIRVFFLSII